MKNYYNILKIDKNATSDEIKIIITKKIEKIKKSHITSEKKKLQLNELEEPPVQTSRTNVSAF